jgi:hypothetical protein
MSRECGSISISRVERLSWSVELERVVMRERSGLAAERYKTLQTEGVAWLREGREGWWWWYGRHTRRQERHVALCMGTAPRIKDGVVDITLYGLGRIAVSRESPGSGRFIRTPLDAENSRACHSAEDSTWPGAPSDSGPRGWYMRPRPKARSWGPTMAILEGAGPSAPASIPREVARSTPAPRGGRCAPTSVMSTSSSEAGHLGAATTPACWLAEDTSWSVESVPRGRRPRGDARRSRSA